ncbi:hypothetical protein [Chitinophaga sp. ARDCPP14]|uniref:P-loop NTPase n=1 Tax=Chitinophaga sp. ARDCPP14 TaxID=3391139 RepID=UPI003F51F6A3
MTKLQEIEKSLVSINEAVFQNVCDSILYHTEENCQNIVRTGTTIGKQKTCKGTPDTYFILPNGRYVLVEYTTKDKSESKKAFLKKAKDDIAKCLDEGKTGLKTDEIEKIIFCFNSRLTTKEVQALRDFCTHQGILLELRGIDTIAFNLIGPCKHTAKEYLGITIDTGQILPPKIFIEEYEHSDFATPLSNKLYGREKELLSLTNSIKNNQITIISGAPGVGKSRLVLEALSELQISNKELTVLCLSNKTAPIHDDLRVYLAEDKPYAIFIDDGNRQSNNLKTLLGLLKEKRTNKIQVVITVRDYALTGIKSECIDYKVADFELLKLDYAQIEQILQGEDFQISKFRYLQRIAEISKGNPRLAIMAARVAIDNQDLTSLNNVYSLYEQYFERTTIDRPVLSDKILLKSIGLLSFFYSINLENVDFVRRICQDFSIDYHEFKEAMLNIAIWELAELSPDGNIIRISEQTLATYFFYKTFLKERSLDFNTILTNYFQDHVHRFNDTVLGANSAFGHTNVLGTIDPYLSKYWQSINTDTIIALKFLKLFWLYRHEDIYEYTELVINNLPEITCVNYIYIEDLKNRGYPHNDEIIELLSNCFPYEEFSYLDAVDLSFQYVKRKPECFQQLLDLLIKNFSIDIEDLYNGCKRQKALLMFLTEKVNYDLIYNQSLFYLLPSFLSYRSYNSSRTDKINATTIVTKKIKIIDAIASFRSGIWSFVIDNYPTYKSRLDDILLSFISDGRQFAKVAHEFDYQYWIKLFNDHFKKNSLQDVFLIQSLIYNYKWLNIRPKDISNLKSRFLTEDYKTYLILSFNRLRDKEDVDFTNYEQYQLLKEKEIRSSFNFKNVAEFKKFYHKYVEMSKLKDKGYTQISVSLDILIHEHSLRDPNLAYSFLRQIISTSNETNFYPIRVLSVFFTSQDKIFLDYYELLINSSFKGKDWWLWSFYYRLPDESVTLQYANDLLQLLSTTRDGIYIEFTIFEKFTKVKKQFFVDALNRVIATKSENKRNIQLDHSFFEKYSEIYIEHVDLLKQIYLLFDNDRDHFDYDCKHLLALIKLDNSFFFEYFTLITTTHLPLHSREFDHLSIIWNLTNAETLVENVLDHFLLRDKRHFMEEIIVSLFKNIESIHMTRGIQFLKNYLKSNINDSKACNFVFDCVRNSFSDHWHVFILYYLSLEADFEKFRRIELLNNSFSSNGDKIWSDIRANDLESILETINKIQIKKYRYSKHKSYIKEWILAERRQADHERKMRFQHKHWH